MKLVENWHDLIPFGIVLFVPETVDHEHRFLFDLTDAGRGLIEKYLGVPSITLAPPWGQCDGLATHVGSILLPPELYEPLAAFVLLETCCTEVWKVDDSLLVGLQATDDKTVWTAAERNYGLHRKYVVRFARQASDHIIHVQNR